VDPERPLPENGPTNRIPAPMSNPYLKPELFQFLRDLKANNDRDWFNENKYRYEQHVKEPLLDMIADFAPLLSGLSPHYRAIPKTVGGSLFRIYRDVRFSKNKDPYKTVAGVHFRHESAKNVHAPGYYFHIEPDNLFLALGIWHPESPTLLSIRNRMVEDPEGWEEMVQASDFAGTYELQGESLKRAPKGFDPEHPLIDDLKRKDFIGVARFDEADAGRPDLLPFLADTWDKGTALMRFLSGALDIPF